ncbi:MAG: ribonuclease P protein component [Planctomycetales bacterium]
MSQRFPKSNRLRKSPEFQRVYQLARRWGDARILMFARRNGLPDTRLGLSVSRRFGGSVQRSRIKRLLREAFRLSMAQLPRGLDLIVIPRQGIAPTLEELRLSLREACRHLERKLSRGVSAGEE